MLHHVKHENHERQGKKRPDSGLFGGPQVGPRAGLFKLSQISDRSLILKGKSENVEAGSKPGSVEDNHSSGTDVTVRL